MSASGTQITQLAGYLRDRRAKLDPAALGFSLKRRRTPGLRREEVAQRANVSATWYTWLEQGRGGAPSADVLDRIARALMLTDAEREHLFFIALGRSPEVRFKPIEGVTPRLQRVLDSFPLSPAIVKTPMWDIVAWNRAAEAVLADYRQIPAKERNILRLMFLDPRARARQTDWQSVARSIVAAFRADAVRAGASEEIKSFVEELSHKSPEFEAMWRDNEVNHHSEGTKHLRHAKGGIIALEYSSFVVDGRPDLAMVVYSPASPTEAEKVRTLLKQHPRTVSAMRTK